MLQTLWGLGCDTYPSQPYTSHALHALSSLKGLGIHFPTRVAPTMVKREHNKGVSKFRVDTDRQQRTQQHYH